MNELEQQKALAKLESFNLCGCGHGGEWEVLLHLLEMGNDHEAKGSFYKPTEGAAAAWVEFGAKVIDAWGLTEHGSGIGWAWLTEDGKQLLDFLREFGVDDDSWPKRWEYLHKCQSSDDRRAGEFLSTEASYDVCPSCNSRCGITSKRHHETAQ